MILHFSQIFLTEGLTFKASPSLKPLTCSFYHEKIIITNIFLQICKFFTSSFFLFSLSLFFFVKKKEAKKKEKEKEKTLSKKQNHKSAFDKIFSLFSFFVTFFLFSLFYKKERKERK